MDSSGEFELEAEDRTAASAGIKAWSSSTVINDSYDSTPTFSGAAETDVVFQEGYTTGFPCCDGVTWCVDIIDGTSWECDSFYVRIRGAGVHNKWLVAHESGHTLGLTHGRNAKPVKAESDTLVGIMGDRDPLPTALGSEPKAQVDNFYG